jgi:hypothetical protein
MDTPPNPFAEHNALPGQAPFAGRASIVSTLRQRLTDPAHARAEVFVGRRQIGKTALLRHLETTLENSHLAVTIACERLPLEREGDTLIAFGLALIDAVAARAAIHRERIPPLPDSPTRDESRRWLADTCLPTLITALRGQRRLLLLLDNADRLIDAIRDRRWTNDGPRFLASLLGPHFYMVITVSEAYEDQLSTLAPLIDPPRAQRLRSLTPDETSALLGHAADRLTLSSEAAEALYQASGGEPALIQRFGYYLWQRAIPHQKGPHPPMGPDDVKAVLPQVYAASETDFRLAWAALTRDERLALTALSSLVYDDPLRALRPADLEAWLVQTDYPMDETAIIAALRGLEYHGIVSGITTGIRLNAGLMQSWLLDHARLSSADTIATREEPRRRAGWWMLIVLALIFAGILVAIQFSGQGGDSPVEPVPTVTLSGD